MTKPILVVRFPYRDGFNYEPHLKHIQEHPVSQDYHVLFTRESDLEGLKFETHNVLNATDIDLEELRNQLQEQFNK
jgi:hypothetical protein